MQQKDYNNSRIWKFINVFSKFGCPICGPNSGCNRKDKKSDRSWKKNRKKQFKMNGKNGI